MSDQAAIVRFLADPASHGGASVDVRETHGSWVFLAGSYAYKLKKNVNFGFLDYSTPERRRYYCEQEVRLNRRLAREIYLGVLAVRESEGQLSLAPLARAGGPALDYIVQMKRLADTTLLSERLKGRGPTHDELRGLVEVLAAFYRSGERGPEIDEYGAPEVIRRNVVENFDQTAHMGGALFPEARFHAIRSAQLSFLCLQVNRFLDRVEGGWIRDGHGDLRAEHVAFVPEPVVIDCIEFNDRLRYGDVAADLAFLKMDLTFLGVPKLADELINLYVDASGDRGLYRVLDFYASYRAYVRAKVEAIQLEQAGADRQSAARAGRAQRYFELSYYHTIGFHEPLCVLISGLSGTGKSTVARRLAGSLGAPVLRSDEVRKELAVDAGERPDAAATYGSGIYTDDFTRRTYFALHTRARELLEAGSSVILDATFSRPEQRELFIELAHGIGAKFLQFECRAPLDVAAERMSRRAREGTDVSDATPEIQAAQRVAYTPPVGAIVLDTTRSAEREHETVLDHLRQATSPD